MRKPLLLSGILALGVVYPAAAQAVDLKFSSGSPPRAHLNVQILKPWAQSVTADSEGTLNIKFIPGAVLANHRTVYDRVINNVVQIAWTIQNVLPGQFPRTSVTSLPLVHNYADRGSRAIWKLYKDGLISEEYKRIKVLGMWAFTPSTLHTKSKIEKIADLKGMKMGISGRVLGTSLAKLGMTPVQMIPPKLYQNLSRGLIQGAAIGWTGLEPFKLDEVMKYHLEAKMGSITGMLFMNKTVFDGLPEKAKAAIQKHSYDTLVNRFGAWWDKQELRIRTKVSKSPGHVIRQLSVEDRKKWLEQLKPVYAAWEKRTPNGAAILKAYRAEISRLSK